MQASRITGPVEAHGVRTPAEYRAKQTRHLAELRATHPGYDWPPPHAEALLRVAYISAGRWVTDCPCGNGPSVSPEWRLACCFECGAVYTQIVLPVEREAIEAVLVRRPYMKNRHWQPGQRAQDLEAENAVRGVAG